MSKIWKNNVDSFLKLADKKGVRMLMIGGGAVNFYGYKRHSADVDFWLDTSSENLKKLLQVLQEMGYDLQDFPDSVKNHQQNISVKFSPTDLDVELITKFNPGKSFDEAYRDSNKVKINDVEIYKYHILSLEDLITSKIKSGRTKDFLDIIELKKIHKI